MLKRALFIALIAFVSLAASVHYSPCSESGSRTCAYGSNVTDKLLNFKKGGSYAAWTNTYDQGFYLCQEYNYNCGYLQEQDDFLTIAEGVQLNLTSSELSLVIPSDPALVSLITPYLGSQGSRAQCLSSYFPLILTDSQRSTVMNGFLARLSSNLSTIYNANRAAGSVVWSALSINIITAVLEVAKLNMNGNFVGTSFFQKMLQNDWAGMSLELKQNHTTRQSLEYLRSAYLIDSTITDYNKQQSVNFLIDESASVGSGNFAQIKSFLSNYALATKDDPTHISISYFDNNLNSVFSQSAANTQASLIASVLGYSCQCNAGSNIGAAINATVGTIVSAGLPKGLPKIIVMVVGSTSSDNVYYAAEYARAQGITLIVIAVGSYNNGQVLQIASTQSNVIYMNSYSLLPNFYQTLTSYLARQFMDLAVGETVTGNKVRVPTNPNYYRVPRSSGTVFHKVTITHRTDPEINQATIYSSHFDPFPDAYSNCNCTEYYRTSIYTYQFYFSPVSSEEIPLKKAETVTQSPAYAYFTVAGNNLDFDIAITTCPTTTCSDERLQAASISSKNHNVNEQEDEDGSNIDNLSIFAAIGTGLATLGIGTYASINGLRKLAESIDEPNFNADLAEGQNTMNQLQQNEQLGGRNGWDDNDFNDANYHDDDIPSLNEGQPEHPSQHQQPNNPNNDAKNNKSKKDHKRNNSHKSEKSEKSDKSDKSEKSEKSQKSEKSEKSEKSNKSNKSNESNKSNQSNKSKQSRKCKDEGQEDVEKKQREPTNILDHSGQEAFNENW